MQNREESSLLFEEAFCPNLTGASISEWN